MYKRDFGILLLSVCALYLSLQNEGAYQFKKAWCVVGEGRARGCQALPLPLPPPGAAGTCLPHSVSSSFHGKQVPPL